MLSKDAFIDFILHGPDRGPAAAAPGVRESALPEGFEGFEEVEAAPVATRPGASFARRLLEASGFGYPDLVQRGNVIRSSDAVARYLPERVAYWPKAAARPYQTLLFEADLTHRELLGIPAFKTHKLAHLDLVEDALARLVSEALEGFARGGEGVTAEVRKGRKEETLCVVSILDAREGEPVRLICFGTENKSTGGLETFLLTEQTRSWDPMLAQERLGLLYERQFKKLEGAGWQDAFATTDERNKATDLIRICTRRAPTEQEIQEGILDLLDSIAKTFGLRKPPNKRRLQAFALPPDHDIGIDPEERERTHGGKNPFGGVTLRDEQSRLLGYIIYPLKNKADAAKLRRHLEQHNRFHNVLVVYPDENQARFELWQGREQLTGRLRKGWEYVDAADVVNLLSRFFVVSRAKVKNPTELAQELAYRARYLRRLAVKQLEDEPEQGPLRNLYNAFKEALVHDQTEAEFADAFAQTITYGLLTARWTGNDQLVVKGERFTRQTALKYLPAASPFLNDLFQTALAVRLDEQRGRLLWLVDDIADLLDRIDVTYVFGAGDKDSDAATDPVIHFYEPFLAAYDKELKNKRGVFFTPRPVVSYIVRSVHELLQKEFGLEDGLASTDTWGDVAQRIPGLQLPEGVQASDPFVCILDPATGTGTFLFECIEVIERTMKERWCRELTVQDWRNSVIVERWNDYVPKHLLSRLYGYELMMASFAISHLKLAFKLNQTGYREGSGERLKIYLTNSLEPASLTANPKLANLFSALALEAQEVNRIKRERHFSVLIGNPPYSKSSANRSEYAESLVAKYKALVSGETNVQPLSDDYVKFMAYSLSATWSTASIVSMITNRSFLEGLIHRGLRSTLVSRCMAIRIIDLHGDSNVGEAPPSGMANENVFDITQGVSIWSVTRRAGSSMAVVEHADVWGTRIEKYDWLRRINVDGCSLHRLSQLSPVAPYYFFAEKDLSCQSDQENWVPLTSLFGVYGMGLKSRRDGFLISLNRPELEARFQRLAEAKDVETLRTELGVTDNDQWTLAGMRDLVRRVGLHEGINEIVYRPFDIRHVWYHREAIERGDARWPVMRNVIDGGITLLSSRQTTNVDFTSAFVVKGLSEMKTAESSRGSYVFPLRLTPVGPLAGKVKTSNLKGELIVNGKRAVDIDAVFAYIYAILHSRTYRSRYLEILRIESPKIPPIKNNMLFDHLVVLGKRLIANHLLEVVDYRNCSADYIGTTNPIIEKVSYSEETVWIDKRKSHGFKGVPEDIWFFRIGGYQVCERWLKERKGEVLTIADIDHYRNVIGALSETIRLMKEIDEVIDQHGGWPGAFVTKPSGAQP